MMISLFKVSNRMTTHTVYTALYALPCVLPCPVWLVLACPDLPCVAPALPCVA